MDTIRAVYARALTVALLLAAGLSTDASAQSPSPCDRTCLRGFVDGYLAALAPDMNRIENGLQTTNVTDNPRSDRHRWSATEQLERAAYAGTVVTERRFPLVDTEHGVAVGIAVFRFAGENGPTLLLAEIFKVASGQLREIRAVVRGIPKGTGAGWPATP